MYNHTYIVGHTAPDTWQAGTMMVTNTERESAHKNYATTDMTSDVTEYNVSSRVSKTTYAAAVSNFGFTGDTSKSAVEFSNYIPSTQTEFVPSYTDSDGTYPASTATITRNYTLSTIDHSTSEQGWTESTGATFVSGYYTDGSGQTVNGVAETPGTLTVTNIHLVNTYNGANSFVSSKADTVDFVTMTTTTGDTVQAWFTTSLSTNSTQKKAWTLSQSSSEITEKAASVITAPVTYAGDYTTVSTVLVSGETYGVPVATDTITAYHFTKKVNSLILMHGGRDADDWNLGDLLWHFTSSALDATASTTGRFTDFFASTGGAIVTLADFEKYETNAVAVTEITYSENTATTSTHIGTGSATSTTVAHTVLVSKNGVAWNQFGTHNVTVGAGTSTTATTGFSDAASNTVTDNHVFSIGDVGTSFDTSYSDTYFTHSVQVTGYSDFSWTSTTETAAFYSSSFTESRLALYSSVSTSMGIILRSTTADTILINSYSSFAAGTDTSYALLGSVSMETTRIFEVNTTTSRAIYDAAFNVEVEIYTTESSYTLAGGDGGETYAISENAQITCYTESRLEPQIFANGVSHTAGNFARFTALPHGFAGFGGTFDVSNLDVFFSINIGLASGEAFSGQTILSANLPTVSAFPHVTLFPVDPSLRISDAQARYISALESIGTASIAATWTSTTTTTGEVTTALTSRFATYTLAGASAIEGTFYSDEPLSTFTSDSFQLLGGYAVGDNNLGNPYTVFANSGFAAWTIGTGSYSTSATGGSVSFTVPGDKAVIFQLEPIFTAAWTGAGDTPHFFSSTPYRG